MEDQNTVHQDVEDTEEIDLTEFEDESPSDDDELEDDQDGQEPFEVPELGIENATEDDQKTWTQRWNGLIKRERRVAANEKEHKALLDNKDRVGQLLQIEQALGSPGHALPVLGQIVAELKRQHRFSDDEIAKSLGLTTASDEDELEFADDKDVYRKAKQDAMRELEAKFGPEFDRLKSADAQRAERQQLTEQVERNFSKITKQVSDMAGVTVKFSRGQVEEALRAEPDIAKKDPAKAVFVHFSSTIRKAMARKSRATGQKGPELIKSSPRSGSGKKADSQKSFSELARERGADPNQLAREMFGL